MENKMICGRKIKDLPSVTIDGEKYYYYNDIDTTIIGKTNEEFIIFSVIENGKRYGVFELNRENSLNRYLEINEKSIRKMAEETRREVIDMLNINIEEPRERKGIFKW